MTTPLVFDVQGAAAIPVPTFDGEPVVKGLEGHLYIVEFDQGGVKVGFTTDPKTRINTHASTAKKFGRRAVRGALTAPHVEAQSNERELIRRCREAAGLPETFTGEYFPVSLQQAAAFIEDMPQSRGDRLAYQARVNAQADGLTQFLLGMPHARGPLVPTPVFPWAVHLDDDQLREFLLDLAEAACTGALAAVDHVVVDWAGAVEPEILASRQAGWRAALEGGGER